MSNATQDGLHSLRPREGFNKAVDQLRYVARASSVMLSDPASGIERVRGRIDRRRDARAFHARGLPIATIYPPESHWLQRLHQALGWSWPCDSVDEAEKLRAETMAMFTARGLPDHYHNWCDGGPAFTKAAWCLTTHLRPATVVETGIARGVTSRIVLEALRRNGAGHLYSIDLPAVDSKYHDQIAIAVPNDLRHDWRTIKGTSRRQLPRLLKRLDSIDLFIHDSLHTGRNTSFEIAQSWNSLNPGGALLVDDIYQSLAFDQFTTTASSNLQFTCVGANDNGGYPFGIAIRASKTGPPDDRSEGMASAHLSMGP